VAGLERREVVKLGLAEYPLPIRIIEAPLVVARRKKAWRVKGTKKDPLGGNEPKSIIET